MEKNLFDELVEVFKNLPNELKPDAKNEFQHYAYNSIQQIKVVVGTELKKRSILFVPQMNNVTNQIIGEDKVLTTVSFQFTFIKKPDNFVVYSYGQAIDTQGKGLSKAKSDAIKRLFTDMFLIATADEDEEKDYDAVSEDKATEAQIKKINVLINKLYPVRAQAESFVNDLKSSFKVEHLHDLTKKQASQIIESLMKQAGEG